MKTKLDNDIKIDFFAQEYYVRRFYALVIAIFTTVGIGTVGFLCLLAIKRLFILITK
jgi:hypothetical protein